MLFSTRRRLGSLGLVKVREGEKVPATVDSHANPTNDNFSDSELSQRPKEHGPLSTSLLTNFVVTDLVSHHFLFVAPHRFRRKLHAESLLISL